MESLYLKRLICHHEPAMLGGGFFCMPTYTLADVVANDELVASFLLQTSEPGKKPSYFPLYWMVNRDPYNGLL